MVVAILWFRGLTGMMMEDLWFFSALGMGRQRLRPLSSCELLSFPFFFFLDMMVFGVNA